MPTKKHPLNTVILAGRVCKPPLFAHSRTGKPMLTVTLAVDRPDHLPQKMVEAEDGHPVVEPDYPVVVIVGDTARELASRVPLGANLFVSGIFQTRNILDRSVQPPRKRVVQEVLSNNARVLESPADMALAQATIESARIAAEGLAPSVESQRKKERNARKRERKARKQQATTPPAVALPSATTALGTLQGGTLSRGTPRDLRPGGNPEALEHSPEKA